ncbi:MAG: ABC transporter ATP-binding protein [Myxococcota bacterium]|nr:ABC transporter ATP-binding protein [Myxococcota bacterium]
MRAPGVRAAGDSEWKGLDWQLIRRIVQFARPHWKPLALSLILMPIFSGLQLLQPYLIKVAIDGPILRDKDPSGLIPIAVLLILVLLVSYSLQFIASYASHIGGQAIVHDLRVAVHRHLLTLRNSYFHRNPAGRLLTRCTNDVEGIGEMFAAGFLTLFGDLVLLVGICAALLALNWKLALVTLAAMPILLGVSQWFQVNLRKTYRELRRRVAALNTYLQERISGIRVIQLFAREERSLREFERWNKELMSENFRSIRLDAALYAFVDGMAHLVTAVLLWWAAKPIIDVGDPLTFGALVAFLDYVSRFFQPIRDLSQKMAILQSGLASSERVFGLLDERDQVPEIAKPHAPPSEEIRGAIRFDAVRFSYQPSEEVLQGLDLEIHAGEKIALLGVTGAGKTTALRLVNRTYDSLGGEVSIDGVDVRDWSLETLRRSVGVVLQEVFLFTGTVRENVGLGDPRIDDERILAALAAVDASEFVDRLGGLDGRISEGGSSLSAGERQLLAFARVMAYNPSILLLDEASSNVDTFAEERIQAAIQTAMHRRTTVVVAHRLSTIQQVDRIAVLHQGQVAELGSHAELFAINGVYRKFYDTYFAVAEPA